MEKTDTEMPKNKNEVTLNKNDVNINDVNIMESKEPLKKRKYNDIMSELLKPPPKEDKPNIHLSGGGQFSKLEKI